ncbi:hypothetical protein F6V25_12810 [Oryzomonas japonica]|uniref:Uncharacterized protein n=1 Tax=Oryzomonas japonica TaxID=2603858 RepID=A0A7J4ZNN8_9BACT|nr:kelch repeat-containing protein [Oryzomonas japonica]KAB0664416.1 hypothetical protein F6V25_12810 [Oryzomonas japonica]
METDTMISMNVRKLLTLIISLAFTLSLCACGGGGGGGGVGIAFNPATYSVAAGGSIPLSVTVTNTSDISVAWSVQEAGGGTVSPIGTYTAPGTAGTYHVVATSNADTSRSAVATITVSALALGSGTTYSGVFANLSSMKAARSNHTATLMTNGKVLIAGGLGSGGAAIASAEFFNPAARAFGQFSSVGNMATTRAYHSATLLLNGKVLLTGGIDSNNAPLASAELFDPATNRFTATGAMKNARWLHTATLLANGKVLVAGGDASQGPGIEGGVPLAAAEIYDPVAGTFTPLTVAMINPRYSHTATLLNSGTVLLAGGQGTGGQKLPESEIFNPTTGTFAATGSMMVDPTVDTGRWLFAALLLRDGTVFVNGGDFGAQYGVNYLASAQVYDPVAGSYADLAAGSLMTYSRAHLAIALRADGIVLITGGIGSDMSDPNAIPPADFLATAELFNATGRIFLPTGSLSSARANHTATSLPNGKILVTGGNQGGSFLKSAEVYQ